MRTLLASLRTMSIPSHQAAIGVARPGIPNTVTNTNTAFIMISLSGVSYQTNYHHQSHHPHFHHLMMNISEIYQKKIHINMFVSSQFSCWHYGFKCAMCMHPMSGTFCKSFCFRKPNRQLSIQICFSNKISRISDWAHSSGRIGTVNSNYVALVAQELQKRLGLDFCLHWNK